MTKQSGEHVYSPTRAVDTTLSFIEEQMGNPATGIKPIVPVEGYDLDPMKQGDLIGVLAYTSNGKTSFINYIVDQYAYQLIGLRKIQPNHKRITVSFSWEQPIEQMIGTSFSRATGLTISDILYGRVTKAQLERMKEEGERRKDHPVWLVGHSIHEKRSRPMLSMKQVAEILDWIDEEAGMIIDLVILDYLQRISYAGSDKVAGIERNCDDARTLAIKQPVLLASQAGRAVFDRDWPMPGPNDSQWSSNFEQSCTGIHCMFRPYQKKLAKIKVDGKEIKVDKHMLVHEMAKQTLGDINIITLFDFGYGGTYLRRWGQKAGAEVQMDLYHGTI